MITLKVVLSPVQVLLEAVGRGPGSIGIKVMKPT